MHRISLAFLAAMAFATSQATAAAQQVDLPTSKALIGEIPGHAQKLNSLPISMAVSPDSRYVVTVNVGYGTFESQYDQSLAVLDTQTGRVADFPDVRTGLRDKQSLYSGLAFSRDGKHIYASMGSITDPEGDGKKAVGNGIAVYSFAEGKIAPERLIPIPMQQLPAGHQTNIMPKGASNKAPAFPAAIAVVGAAGSEKLLVANNVSDNALLLDAASGKIEKAFDLTESNVVPSTYPVALALAPDGKRAFVALWNSSEIAELDLAAGKVGRKLALLKPSSPTAAGTHPSALTLLPDGKTLYVALSNRDAVAAVNISAGRFSVKGYFDTRLPGQSYFGAEPVALALDASGDKLYVADSVSDAVAVIDTRKLSSAASKQGMVEPTGFLPTEWMPISMAFIPSTSGGKLYLATGKGHGTGPNNFPQAPVPGGSGALLPNTYIATLLYGSLATLDASEIDKNLAHWTAVVMDSNRMKAAQEKIAFAGGAQDKIKHVIYIIKENRTYDQILGDLKQDGKQVGNGDPTLAMYGESITPNEHRLALQFGLLDNFFDSGEVSGNGHVWSNAAINSDYDEKTWQQDYRGSERTYDYEGVVANGYPLLQKIPDVNEPASGYLWTNLAAHGKTYYHFGEYISSTFCGQHALWNPQFGTMLEGHTCAKNAIAPGEMLPAEWGGGINKWPWSIPLIATNIATKPELVGHFAAEAPDFNLSIPDQIRADVILRHLDGWISDRKQGKDTMPSFITIRMGNDHTAGTTPGGPSPKSSVADNDLAVGRLVDAVSHSPYWDDTAFFILEDDAQAGADHVDAHRSIAIVVSKYSPHAQGGATFIDSKFYTTVSVIRTMESLLGLPPMNNNDALCPLIASLFAGPGDQPAYSADYSNRENNLIYTANQKNAVGARESSKMDFTHADRAPAEVLNVILWKDAMGDKTVPPLLKVHSKKAGKDDDDD